MAPDLDDFRKKVLAHAKLATDRAPKVDSEAKANVVLVQPFLAALGYDVGNPDEVSPEHHADFSEKYKNKVDFAILTNGAPVIAIELKKTGAEMRDDRGQLRSYFNACHSVKLGILTDGMKFEFYADSDKPNMMDETAFLRFDLAEIAKTSSVDDNTLGGIAAIRRGLFNPEDVGTEAKRKMLFESIVDVIKLFKTAPSDDFVRFIIGCSSIGGKITKVTQKIVDANRELVREAMEAFVAQEALARFGYAPKDVVKASDRTETVGLTTVAAVVDQEPLSVTPSDGELGVFNYTKSRLYFLVRSDTLFREVTKLTYKKTKTSFRLYYEKPNSGSIFDYKEHKDGKKTVEFPALAGKELVYHPSSDFDDCLLKAFCQRTSDAGIISEATPVLRTISGGQS